MVVPWSYHGHLSAVENRLLRLPKQSKCLEVGGAWRGPCGMGMSSGEEASQGARELGGHGLAPPATSAAEGGAQEVGRGLRLLTPMEALANGASRRVHAAGRPRGGELGAEIMEGSIEEGRFAQISALHRHEEEGEVERAASRVSQWVAQVLQHHLGLLAQPVERPEIHLDFYPASGHAREKGQCRSRSCYPARRAMNMGARVRFFPTSGCLRTSGRQWWQTARQAVARV